MLLYSLSIIPISILFMAFSIAIYNGKTDLIHSYHQTKVTAKAAYGKAFGKALSVIGFAILFSGLIGLAGDSEPVVIASIAVLMIGLCIGIICICIVQKKYNNGIF